MVRHRREAIDPKDKLAVWRLNYRKKYGDSPPRDRMPEGYDANRYNAFRDHDVFCWEVKAFLRDETRDIQGIIYNYWRIGFKRPFPKEGGSLYQLCTAIRLKLLRRGFELNNIDEDPEDCIKKRFKQLIPHRMRDYKINSQPKEEIVMSKRDDDDRNDRKKKKKKGYSAEDDDDQDDRRSRKKKKSKGDDDQKKKKKSKDRDQSAQCRIMCAELLMERKYTDDEISELIEDEIGIKYSAARVNRIREGINNGVRGKPPTPPLEEIEKGGGKKKKKSRKDEDEEDDDRKSRKKKSGKNKSRRRRDEDED